MWYQRKPDLSNLKVFGTKAISYVIKQKRKGKLDLPGREYTFVGYGVNGFRLFDHEKWMIVMAKSIQFDERTSAETTVFQSSPLKEDAVASVQPTSSVVTQSVVNSGTPFMPPHVTSTPRSWSNTLRVHQLLVLQRQS